MWTGTNSLCLCVIYLDITLKIQTKYLLSLYVEAVIDMSKRLLLHTSKESLIPVKARGKIYRNSLWGGYQVKKKYLNFCCFKFVDSNTNNAENPCLCKYTTFDFWNGKCLKIFYFRFFPESLSLRPWLLSFNCF